MQPGTDIKGANKDTKIYVGRSKTVRSLWFFVHTIIITLCMNYVYYSPILTSDANIGVSISIKEAKKKLMR